MSDPTTGRWTQPRSETELLQFRPPNHHDGVFPRRLLQAGERVLFETRPASLASNRWLTGALLFLFVSEVFVTGAAVVVAAGHQPATYATAYAFVLQGIPGLLLWGGLLAILYQSRRSTAYALTQRRVLAVAGFWSSRFQFLDRTHIARMWSPDGQGRWIAFEASASDQAGARGAGVVDWKDLTWGFRTLAFVQSAFTLEAQLDAQRATEAHRRAAVLQDRVVCAYCGNPVQYSVGDDPPRTCPRCSAPLPSPSEGSPPSGPAPKVPARGDLGLIPALRPVVQLAQDAVQWYRPVPVLWAVLLGALAFLLYSFSLGISSGSPVVLVLALTALTAVVVGYILWVQATRKWATVVITAQRALPSGSPSTDRLLASLRRSRILGWAGLLASIILWVVTPVAVAFGQPGFANTTPSPGIAVASLTAGFAAAVAATVVAQWGLVLGPTRLIEGSEIPDIERDRRRGRRVAIVGLLVGFSLPVLLSATFLGSVPLADIAPLLLVAEAGPIAVIAATLWTSRALTEWSNLAERVIVPTVEHGVVRAVGEGPKWGVAGATPTLRRTLVASPWTRVGVLVAAVVLVLSAVSGLGWLTPSLNVASASVHLPPPPLPPPKVIIPNGTVWALPAYYYEYQRFALSENGTLTGAFSSDQNVYVYVLDFYEFNDWYNFGTLGNGARFNSGNVTSAQFYLPIGPSTDWYVVVLNLSHSVAANVTWTSSCVLEYTS